MNEIPNLDDIPIPDEMPNAAAVRRNRGKAPIDDESLGEADFMDFFADIDMVMLF